MQRLGKSNGGEGWENILLVPSSSRSVHKLVEETDWGSYTRSPNHSSSILDHCYLAKSRVGELEIVAGYLAYYPVLLNTNIHS
jgi:hypothetical protein